MSPPGARPASQSSTADGVTAAAVEASRAAPTAARALRVVELCASEPFREWRLAEFQRELGYSHGNLHAIVATLVAMGYLRRDGEGRAYRLGPALLELGSAARVVYPSVALAITHLDRLADRIGTEAHAAMRVGRAVLVVARRGPIMPFGRGVHVGERIPLTPPIGSTFLAWAGPDEVERYLASAESVLTADELADMRARLRDVRRRGYSVHVLAHGRNGLGEAAARVVTEARDDLSSQLPGLSHDLLRRGYLSEHETVTDVGDGVQFSAPVFDAAGRVELSIGVAVPGPGVGAVPLSEIPGMVVSAADAITTELGGTPPS